MSMPGVGGVHADSGFGRLPPDQQRRIRMENEQWLKQPGNDFFQSWVAENAFGLGDPLILNREAKKYSADAAAAANPNYQRYYDEVMDPYNQGANAALEQGGSDAWFQYLDQRPMSYQDWFAKNIQPTLNKPAQPVSRQPAPAPARTTPVSRQPAPAPAPRPAPVPVSRPLPVPQMRPAPAPAPRPAPVPQMRPAPVPVRGPAPVPVAALPGRVPSVQPPLMTRPAPVRR